MLGERWFPKSGPYVFRNSIWRNRSVGGATATGQRTHLSTSTLGEPRTSETKVRGVGDQGRSRAVIILSGLRKAQLLLHPYCATVYAQTNACGCGVLSLLEARAFGFEQGLNTRCSRGCSRPYKADPVASERQKFFRNLDYCVALGKT